ncbi:MAG TPA: hypothetical protein VF824_06520 [Thermoanaerobaculia bacterium]|jgi:hypothetical protein
MQSRSTLIDVDFERDVPTSAADVAALERARAATTLSPQAYLEFLLAFRDSSPPDRELPLRHEPFDLNLERDMPLTAADLEALARSRNLRPLTPEEYQEWCDLIAKHHPSPHRDNSYADEPFEL